MHKAHGASARGTSYRNSRRQTLAQATPVTTVAVTQSTDFSSIWSTYRQNSRPTTDSSVSSVPAEPETQGVRFRISHESNLPIDTALHVPPLATQSTRPSLSAATPAVQHGFAVRAGDGGSAFTRVVPSGGAAPGAAASSPKSHAHDVIGEPVGERSNPLSGPLAAGSLNPGTGPGNTKPPVPGQPPAIHAGSIPAPTTHTYGSSTASANRNHPSKPTAATTATTPTAAAARVSGSVPDNSDGDAPVIRHPTTVVPSIDARQQPPATTTAGSTAPEPNVSGPRLRNPVPTASTSQSGAKPKQQQQRHGTIPTGGHPDFPTEEPTYAGHGVQLQPPRGGGGQKKRPTAQRRALPAAADDGGTTTTGAFAATAANQSSKPNVRTPKPPQPTAKPPVDPLARRPIAAAAAATNSSNDKSRVNPSATQHTQPRQGGHNNHATVDNSKSDDSEIYNTHGQGLPGGAHRTGRPPPDHSQPPSSQHHGLGAGHQQSHGAPPLGNPTIGGTHVLRPPVFHHFTGGNWSPSETTGSAATAASASSLHEVPPYRPPDYGGQRGHGIGTSNMQGLPIYPPLPTATHPGDGSIQMLAAAGNPYVSNDLGGRSLHKGQRRQQPADVHQPPSEQSRHIHSPHGSGSISVDRLLEAVTSLAIQNTETAQRLSEVSYTLGQRDGRRSRSRGRREPSATNPNGAEERPTLGYTEDDLQDYDERPQTHGHDSHHHGHVQQPDRTASTRGQYYSTGTVSGHGQREPVSHPSRRQSRQDSPVPAHDHGQGTRSSQSVPVRLRHTQQFDTESESPSPSHHGDGIPRAHRGQQARPDERSADVLVPRGPHERGSLSGLPRDQAGRNARYDSVAGVYSTGKNHNHGSNHLPGSSQSADYFLGSDGDSETFGQDSLDHGTDDPGVNWLANTSLDDDLYHNQVADLTIDINQTHQRLKNLDSRDRRGINSATATLTALCARRKRLVAKQAMIKETKKATSIEVDMPRPDDSREPWHYKELQANFTKTFATPHDALTTIKHLFTKYPAPTVTMDKAVTMALTGEALETWLKLSDRMRFYPAFKQIAMIYMNKKSVQQCAQDLLAHRWDGTTDFKKHMAQWEVLYYDSFALSPFSDSPAIREKTKQNAILSSLTSSMALKLNQEIVTHRLRGQIWNSSDMIQWISEQQLIAKNPNFIALNAITERNEPDVLSVNSFSPRHGDRSRSKFRTSNPDSIREKHRRDSQDRRSRTRERERDSRRSRYTTHMDTDDKYRSHSRSQTRTSNNHSRASSRSSAHSDSERYQSRHRSRTPTRTESNPNSVKTTKSGSIPWKKSSYRAPSPAKSDASYTVTAHSQIELHPDEKKPYAKYKPNRQGRS